MFKKFLEDALTNMKFSKKLSVIGVCNTDKIQAWILASPGLTLIGFVICNLKCYRWQEQMDIN